MSEHDESCEVEHNTSLNACGCELRAEVYELRQLAWEALAHIEADTSNPEARELAVHLRDLLDHQP